MYFFGCLILLLLIVLIFIPALIMSAVTGAVDWFTELITGKKPSSHRRTGFEGYGFGAHGNNNSGGTSSHSAQQTGQMGEKRKIIPDDEGEYVDFEEVKE